MKKILSVHTLGIILSLFLLFGWADSNESKQIVDITIDLSEGKYMASMNKAVSALKTANYIQDLKDNLYSIQKGSSNTDFIRISLRMNSVPPVELIVSRNDLYLVGFCNLSNTSKYYYFSDTDPKNNAKCSKTMASQSLGYNSNYNTLTPKGDVSISYANLSNAMFALNKANPNLSGLKSEFVRIIFVTSEALRFIKVRSDIDKITKSGSKQDLLWKNYSTDLKNWDTYSQEYYNQKPANAKAKLHILNSKK